MAVGAWGGCELRVWLKPRVWGFGVGGGCREGGWTASQTSRPEGSGNHQGFLSSRVILLSVGFPTISMPTWGCKTGNI